MYQKVLVPLDGSPLAEKLIPYANRMADWLGVEITFLHVCTPGETSSQFMCKAYVEHIAGQFRTSLETKGMSSKKQGKALGEITSGEPAQSILDYAGKNNTDLILMGTHGRSGIASWTMGSVSHRVIIASKIPLLLVRQKESQPIITDDWPKTILIPLDGSKLGESIFTHIEMLAKQGNTKPNVILLRVCEPPDLISDYPEAALKLPWDDHVKTVTEASENACSLYLGEAQDRLEAIGVRTSLDVMLGGNVAGEITNYVHKTHCDLIAMSTHGRSGISEWPYGHIADRLVRTVSMPLFLARPVI